MAKLVLAMCVSLDGYIEGPDGVFIPPPWSDEVERCWSLHSLPRAGRLLYGRVNFMFNKGFWSAAETDPDSVAAGISYAGVMNGLPKTVVSRSLAGDPGWNGAVADGPLAEVVGRLKAGEEKDIYSFGGAGLANSLVAEDLVDEYRIMVTPMLFGGGKRLFEAGFPPLSLTLVDMVRLDVGSVILHYRRDRG